MKWYLFKTAAEEEEEVGEHDPAAPSPGNPSQYGHHPDQEIPANPLLFNVH